MDCNSHQRTNDLSKQNKEVIQKIFNEVWNEADLTIIDQVYRSDYVAHVSGAPDDVEGLEHYKEFVALHSVLASDLHFSIDDQIAEGDQRKKSTWKTCPSGTLLLLGL